LSSFSETFTGSGALAGYNGWTDTVGTWTRDGSSKAYSNHQNNGSAPYNDLASNSYTQGSADGSISFTIADPLTGTGETTTIGVVLRQQSDYSGIHAGLVGNYYQVGTVSSNGTLTPLAYHAVDGATTQNLVFTIAGQHLSLIANGNSVLSYTASGIVATTGHVGLVGGYGAIGTQVDTTQSRISNLSYADAGVPSVPFTLTGPSTATVGTSITITVSPSTSYTGTVTLIDGLTSGIGIFSPTTLTWAGTTTAQTATYTAYGPTPLSIQASANTGSPSISTATPLAVTVSYPVSYRIVVNGDSRTNGSNAVGATEPSTYTSGSGNGGCNGLSYTFPTTSTEMPAVLLELFGPTATAFNAGISGETSAGAAANAIATYSGLTAQNQTQHPQGGFVSGKTNLVVIWFGANDPSVPLTPSQTWSNLQAIAAAYKTYGYTYAFVCTEPNTTRAGSTSLSSGTYEQYQQPLNALIRSGWQAGGFDGVIDFGSDGRMGIAGAASNTTYYADGTHPTAAGYSILAEAVSQALHTKLLVAAPTGGVGGGQSGIGCGFIRGN
jgi:lysophospholipase L1-like esterase